MRFERKRIEMMVWLKRLAVYAASLALALLVVVPAGIVMRLWSVLNPKRAKVPSSDSSYWDRP